MAIIGSSKKDEYYSYDEYCNNCAETRKLNGEAPRIKLALKNKTRRKNLTVAVCPECDGPALDFALKNSR